MGDVLFKRLQPPLICDWCSSSNIKCEIGINELSNAWVCYNCHAKVSCEVKTNHPLGYMAPNKIRIKRAKLHSKFDLLWKTQMFSRDEAYQWLAIQLHLDAATCHIAMLTEAQLDSSIELCESYVNSIGNIKLRRKKKKNEQLIDKFRQDSKHANARRSRGRPPKR
jgi:hypothetical protein